MSAQPSLQTRIIEVIRANQPLRAKDLCHYLPDIDAPALDCAVTALMRSNKVSLLGAHYDLVQTERPQMQKKRAEEAAEPPTAAEEAAASLTSRVQMCEDCNIPLPIEHFQCVRGEKRLKICRGCMGKRAQGGRLRNHIESDPQDRKWKPTATLDPPNTPLEATAVSPETSLEKEPLPAADSAGRFQSIPPAPESALTKLERKRDALVARREQLTVEYEANLKEAIDRAAEIDHLLAEVKRLSEEPG